MMTLEQELVKEGVNTNFKVGDKFFYPEDQFGVTVDYILVKIDEDNGEDNFLFKPMKSTYVWKGEEYRIKDFSLKRKDIITLLWKKVWIRID